MTFDDGILTIYNVSNSADEGEKPVFSLTEKSKHYYNFGELGYGRYYTALQAQQRIECVVNVPDWLNINVTDICALDNEEKYKIVMVQKLLNNDNLKITRLSLEKVGDIYEF